MLKKLSINLNLIVTTLLIAIHIYAFRCTPEQQVFWYLYFKYSLVGHLYLYSKYFLNIFYPSLPNPLWVRQCSSVIFLFPGRAESRRLSALGTWRVTSSGGWARWRDADMSRHVTKWHGVGLSDSSGAICRRGRETDAAAADDHVADCGRPIELRRCVTSTSCIYGHATRDRDSPHGFSNKQTRSGADCI